MATVPGLNLLCFFIPPSAGAVFFLAWLFLPAFEPVATLYFDCFPFFPATFCLGIVFLF
jgi:hypothetical protein